MPSVVASDQISRFHNRKFRERWVQSSTVFVFRPLDEGLNVPFCSRVKSDLPLVHSEARVSLEVNFKHADILVNVRHEVVVKDLGGNSLCSRIAVEPGRIIDAARYNSVKDCLYVSCHVCIVC
jgi:hypothetical protein